MTKFWLIVVLMELPSPQPNTPAYVPYVTFQSLAECKEFVLVNQTYLYMEAVRRFEGYFMPSRAVCVDDKLFYKMFYGEPKVIEEDL